MSFIQRAFIKWLIPQISSQMRSPESSITGIIAMSLMKRLNTQSIRKAISRLQLKRTDTFVEIGAGNGDGLAALLKSKIPKRVVLIEISEPFRDKLHKLIEQSNTDTSHIEIRSEDCISMPYLKDNSVNKIFGFNLVYFLHPLDTYLQEMKRVLKPGGIVAFGCKFGSIPKEGTTKEFVNVNRKEICAALSRQGFDVTMNKVVVDKDNEMSNYIEIVGMKPFDVAEWEKHNLVAVMESSQ